ncbi:acetyl-CoA carboxylase, carboxyltransferase subunit beta [Effusibacillus dendaii]|uniref:Acetyl-coenzyme A carboxylase carboxyl transferase subunit beta n=1 Tax=Effusibacillus dendaii TaxID=2743772 RepID=A0A7I8DHC6_9BACL|nr:acetyl-CoA carboxylase, carboxyltransferase subunit beta [Effusibacillus dendaii]BCJ88020.1 acetyl-coenzyme A carboxylase carboxyl transferase subunit beta [Effusibacillus dendaii]
MLKDLFQKKRKYATIPTKELTDRRDNIPAGIMTKCKQCSELLISRELEKHLKTCPRCGYHFPISAPERISFTLDEGSFIEYDKGLTTADPLQFADYPDKIRQVQEATGLTEGVLTGQGTIEGLPLVIGVMDSRFIMGSMGSVVGEKIARAIERAIEQRYPVVLFAASGGARMQEGVFSLMQMAKTSAALNKLRQAGLLYISVLTHPTTGGVSASFASLGDLNIAEPGALIGFAGRRVIEQTIRQQLPEDFQTAEFLLKHGMLDLVVHRKEMKHTLAKILDIHAGGVRRGE